MRLETMQSVQQVRDLLKRWSIIIYTGDTLDDIALMEIELEDLFEGKHVESEEYLKYRLILRAAYSEVERERESGGISGNI